MSGKNSARKILGLVIAAAALSACAPMLESQKAQVQKPRTMYCDRSYGGQAMCKPVSDAQVKSILRGEAL